jgi:rare lipoprotein A
MPIIGGMKKIVTIIALGLLIAVSAGAQAPLPENGGFRQEGLASWYGAEFAGRPTASGQIFDPTQLTAAHPTLAFGTVLTVTNIVNNKLVQVTVNDRGPFAGGRIIDVSRAAAERLDMLETGVIQVVIEVAPRYASSMPAAPTSMGASSPDSGVSGSGGEATDDENTYYPVQRPAVTAGSGTTPQGAPSGAAGGGSSSLIPLPPPAPPRTFQPVPTASSAGSIPTTTAPKNMPAPGTSRPANPADAARSSIAPVTPSLSSATPPAQNTGAATPQQIQPVQAQTNAAPSAPASSPSYLPLPPATPVFPTPSPSTPAATPPVSNANPLADTPPAAPADPGVNIKPRPAPAEIKGGPVVPGRVYRLQIGSFKTPRNAVETFDRLSNAGLNPSWEPFGEYYRIVLTNIKAEDVPAVADKLGQAGFKEAVARIEAYEE